tara:strand:- start:511 stop:1125 length:615 start_codon:yes stop_codon:yes gene_type:complete
MARYASGKKSNAMSDISGFKVRYKDLKTTWNNLRVEPEEFDPKQPQLTPAKNIIDATALFKPRPDNDPDNVTFFVGFTQDWTIDPRLLPGIGMHGKGAVGNGSISEITISPNPSGDAGTGAIGSELLELSIAEAGVAGTGAVGTASPVGVKGVSGTAGTGAVGVEALNLSIAEAGVAGTGAVGTESVQILGWGQEGWGINGWGE